MNSTNLLLKNNLKKALKHSVKTSIWILKIILPVSLIVALLKYFGFIDFLSLQLSPIFRFIGLPGKASIAYLSSLFLPLYAPIAIITTLGLSVRETTILALMCLIAHNLPVETAIQKKTGTKVWQTLCIRIGFSLLAGIILQCLLPEQMPGNIIGSADIVKPDSIGVVFAQWATSSLWLSLKIICIITALMVLQAILKSYGWFDKIAEFFSPLMKIFGLPKNQSFLWLTAQTVGLAYGSAILLAEAEEKQLPKEEIDLFNYHVAVNHSLLEDTLIFAMIGVPVLWIIVPRLCFAMILVWSVILIKQQINKKTKKASLT